MKKLLQPHLSSAALSLVAALAFAPTARAVISVGASGSGTITFPTLPANTEWSTLSVPGATADVNSDAGLDGAMGVIAASTITNTLATQAGSGTQGSAYWRSGDFKLGTQPTGNKMTLLMATLKNTSGSTLTGVRVAYTLGLTLTPAETIKGHRVYWSKTGAQHSWTAVGDVLLAVPGTTNVTCDLDPVGWANGTTLYVVWADDNGSNPDGDYTIDAVSFAAAPPTANIAAFDFGLPAAYGPATISGANISINVPNTTDVTALKPTFTLSTGATCDKVSGGPTTYDFTSPQTYTVTSSDTLVTQAYTVTVNLQPVVDISTILTPGPQGPSQGIVIDTTVGAGNFGRLVGSTETYWGSGGFSVPLDLNTNTLIIDSGGGNPMNASGPIFGDGVVRLQDGGANPIRIQGYIGNTYNGPTYVTGNVSLEKTSGDALRGPITNNASASLVWVYDNQINDASDVTLATGAFLNLAGHTDTIHNLYLVTGSYVQTGAGGVLKVAALFINGVQQPNVAYIAGDGYVLGTGYIDVGGSGPPVVVTLPAGPSSPVPTNSTTGIHPMMLTKLDWADSSGAASYDVYLWLAGDSQPATPTANVAISEYPLTLPLVSLTNYNWQVVAKNAVGPTNGPIWSFSTTDRSHISNALTPAQPTQPSLGVWIDNIVGVGNTGVLVGVCQTFWEYNGFTVPLNLNGNQLIVDSGGGNVPYGAYGPIFGTGSVTFNTVTAPNTKISVTGDNTYSGPTTVTRGWISLENTTGGDALLGSITVGSGSTAVLAWTANDQINDNADVTLVTAGSYLELAGFNDTIRSLTLPFGTYVDTDNMGGASPAGVLTVSSLTLGGSPQPSGIYDVSAAPDYILGYGSIVVVAAAPPFPASGFTMPGGVPTFAIPDTVSTSTYTLFYKDNLTDASWMALTGSGTALGNGGTLSLSDPSSPLPAQRFYRLGRNP